MSRSIFMLVALVLLAATCSAQAGSSAAASSSAVASTTDGETGTPEPSDEETTVAVTPKPTPEPKKALTFTAQLTFDITPTELQLLRSAVESRALQNEATKVLQAILKDKSYTFNVTKLQACEAGITISFEVVGLTPEEVSGSIEALFPNDFLKGLRKLVLNEGFNAVFTISKGTSETGPCETETSSGAVGPSDPAGAGSASLTMVSLITVLTLALWL